MKSRKIRMIGIDLDGTLLTKNKELTPASKKAMEDAERAGIEVVPVTGRPFSGIPEEILKVRGIRYVITSNGANTYRLGEEPSEDTPVLLRKAHLSHETAKRVLETSPEEDVIREIFVRGYGYHEPRSGELLEERFSGTPVLDYIRRSRKALPEGGIAGLLQDASSHVENISLMFPSKERRDDVLEKICRINREEGGPVLQILLPWKTDLEITSVLADKWLALRDLAGRLGIEDAEVMTIGDGDNDRPMLRGAGLSFAMGNAPNFVREAADAVTLDNEHDGAALAIRQVISGKE